jgi:hypothetical protein
MTSAPPPPPAQPAAPPAAAPPPTPPAAPPTPPPTPPSGQAADAEPSGEEPSGEDFAKLPRIPPFTDFELEPVEQQFDEPRQYTGRRRRPDDTDPNLGRHAQPGAPQQRYRQDPSDVDEILARLLPPRNTNGRS